MDPFMLKRLSSLLVPQSVRNAYSATWRTRRIRLRGRLARLLHRPGRGADLQTYLLMKADNDSATNRYRAGDFWRAINADFADCIYGGAVDTVRNGYINRRFSGPEPCSRQVYEALVWMYYNLLVSIDTQGFLKDAVEPPEGGTEDQVSVDGRQMSLDFLQSVEEVYRLRAAWSMAGSVPRRPLIVELGAGYGRLAYACRKMIPDCTYVILDLPEALLCANSWLGRVIPGEVVPYATSRLVNSFTVEMLRERKVWILGAHQIEALPSASVDAFVNVYSLAEMPTLAIDNYFAHIDRLTDGVFYSKQRTREDNQKDGITVSCSSYPVRTGWKTTMFRKSTLYEQFFEAAYSIRHTRSPPGG